MNYFGNEPQAQNNTYYDSSPFTESLMPPTNNEPTKVADLYQAGRVLFIQRVYTILACQLVATVLMTALSMYSFAFFKFQMENFAILMLAMVVCIVIQIYMFCCSGGRTFPMNMILTAVFTLAQSYIVSFIASATGMTSGNSLVLMAALMTLAVTVACTLYAIYTKQDYTTSSAIIVVITVVMLCLFIVMLFTDSPLIHALYCGLGVLLFGIYIVVDTQLIIGNRGAELAIDDYYLGAMFLYIDIISIFIYLLQLLGMASSNSNQS